MFAAETCTGLRISTPISMRSGIRSRTAPQVWKKTFASDPRMEVVEQLAVQRLHELAVGLRGEQGPVLAAEIVGLHEHVGVLADLGQRPLPVRELDLQDPLHDPTGERRVPGEVHVPLLEPAELEQPLGEAPADRAHGDRATFLASRTARASPPMPAVRAGSVGVRPGERVHRGEVDVPVQRRRVGVEVQPAVQRHPAADAPLVDERAVPVDLADLAPVRGSGAGRHEPDIRLDARRERRSPRPPAAA